MRLMAAVAMQTIDAGGPGSGRYPAGSTGNAGQTTYNPEANTEHPFHQTLMDHGFVHTGSVKKTHFYKGEGERTPPSGESGKKYGNAAWTAGHGVVLSTDRYKRTPRWHDSGDMNRQGETEQSLKEHLGKVGWHKHGE